MDELIKNLPPNYTYEKSGDTWTITKRTKNELVDNAILANEDKDKVIREHELNASKYYYRLGKMHEQYGAPFQ